MPSEPESGLSTPILAAFDSSSALILVHDDDDGDNTQDIDNTDAFNFSSDSTQDAQESIFLRPYIPPLGSMTVFLYLLSPYLKLGAILLPNTDMSLKFSLPALFLFATLAAFVRQIWYMLSRHLRKVDLQDVLVNAFSKSKGNRSVRERIRQSVRTIIRASTGVLRLFLATTYLREGTHALLPSLPEDIYISNWAFTLVLAVILYPFAIARSLSSKRVVCATWASIVTYLLWFICVVYAHANDSLAVHPGWSRMGALWQGITTIAFTFSSSSTLSLYASLKAGAHTAHSAASKSPLSRSFKFISFISVAVAICFTIPLLVLAAFPNKPKVQDAPSHRLGPFIQSLGALTLLLGIPSILITAPSLPIPERLRHTTTFPLSKALLFIVIVILSLAPVNISRVYSDIVLVCALTATYFLPALVHIITHFFKRPLSIIVPTIATSSPNTPNNPHSTNYSSGLPSLADSSSSSSGMFTLPNSANDPLLQRKELMLQRKQLGKRIMWDVGVWVLLLPVGGGGFVWAVGRITGRW
ncbi:hypothetical protein D9757_003415 [Collybiopsis confluens]|uniref:Uncharacterized protein n=1 Tax=Collybiopsis confluens TaxID=2823264 RepID=A0A8H5HTW5_9AGAR|nr:hypothetical protein D9757_003415 [Collybiopsis confluens]